MLRKMLLAAAIVAPLAWAPAEASAQDGGSARAAAATARGQEAAQNKAPTGNLPPEIAELFQGGLPPGLANLVAAADEGSDQTGDTTGDVCEPTPVVINNRLLIQNCDGTYTDPLTGQTVTP